MSFFCMDLFFFWDRHLEYNCWETDSYMLKFSQVCQILFHT